MAKLNVDELKAVIGDRKVTSPFDDILVTDVVDMGAKEHDAYINMVKKEHGSIDDVKAIAVLMADDDYVDVHYVCQSIPFERIRRITGYLVGTIDRWNDAKKAEERERVKHALSA